MSLPIVLRPEARAEFDDAFDWYEQQRHGLGMDFVAHVQEVLDRISDTPERYVQVFQDIRRVVVQRFPYSIFYKVEPQQVVVLAVFHSSRNPTIWQARA
jgi:plasmid stabilization system protein ParE